MQGRNNQGNNQERNNQGTQETRNFEQEQKKTGNPIIKRILVECISLVAGIVILLFMTGGKNGFSWWEMERYVDIVVLVLIIVLTFPTVVSSGLWKDFLRIFSLHKPERGWKLHELKRSMDAIEVLQKQLLYAAVMIIMFQLINTLYNMENPASLGPCLAHIFMTGLYTAILELLLMPLKVEVKKQITDFMEEN